MLLLDLSTACAKVCHPGMVDPHGLTCVDVRPLGTPAWDARGANQISHGSLRPL